MLLLFSSCESYFDYSESERQNALHMGLIYRIKMEKLAGKLDSSALYDSYHDSVEEYNRIYCSPHGDVVHGFYAYDGGMRHLCNNKRFNTKS
jgi:hypothetical protein